MVFTLTMPDAALVVVEGDKDALDRQKTHRFISYQDSPLPMDLILALDLMGALRKYDAAGVDAQKTAVEAVGLTGDLIPGIK